MTLYRSAMLLGLLAGAAVSAWGQRQTGELRLSVIDAGGLPVRAQGTLVSLSTDVHRSIRTNEQGNHAATDLPFGLYRVTLEAAPLARAELLVPIRSQVPVEKTVALKLTPVVSSVTVSASGAGTLLSPRTSNAAHVGSEALLNRPAQLPGRGLLELVARQPGWVLEAHGVLHPRGSEYDTQYVVNGIPILDNRSPAFAPAFSPEEVQSVRVITAGFPAEYGRKMGGVVEVTTNSVGRAGLHGDAMLQAGDLGTRALHAGLQYGVGATYFGVRGDAGITDRFLDPPHERNFGNRGGTGGGSGWFSRDLTPHDRLRVYAHRKQVHFLVPNELDQHLVGQRQDNTRAETITQLSWQRILSPQWVADVRGMARDVSARLWSNSLAIPIIAGQDRGFREGYVNTGVAGALGRHVLKFGGETSLLSLREEFSYRITQPSFFEDGGELEFPEALHFQARRRGRDTSAYIQDTVQLGRLTLNAGIRWDRYRMLVSRHYASPRIAAAWHIPRTGTVLRASYDRVATYPAIENLLLTGSREAWSLTEETSGLPLEPARGNYWDFGFSQSLGNRLRLDGSYFRRSIRNYADDDVFLHTGISFPMSFDRAFIHGVEARLEIPRWWRISGLASYSNLTGVGYLPLTGGLFLDEDAAELLSSRTRFPISQDQRNTVQARMRLHLHRKVWTGLGFFYNSGLPVEREGEFEDEDAFVDSQELRRRFGDSVVDQVDFARGRVKPSHGFDVSLSWQLHTAERGSLRLQSDVRNLTNRLNVVNFAGLFSGTAIGMPRTVQVRLLADF
jgi:hypothetical protein